MEYRGARQKGETHDAAGLATAVPTPGRYVVLCYYYAPGSLTLPVVSNSVVVFFRLLTSAWIRLNEDDFAAFLFDPESTGPLSVRQFCETQVEATGREAGLYVATDS